MTDETPTILIVEDERELADLFAAWLAADYECQLAYNGREALDQITDATDVILLDRRMPGLSGDEVLDELRNRGYRCPVGMVTAVEPDFDIVEMGFDDYIIKPVTAAELREFVSSLHSVSEYDTDLQELFRLSAKRASLEASKNETELARNQDYQRLLEQIAELKAVADASRDELLENGSFSRWH